MNIIVLFIGLALLGLAGILFVRAVSFSRMRAVGSLGQIDSYGYATAVTPAGPARTSIRYRWSRSSSGEPAATPPKSSIESRRRCANGLRSAAS